jgi:hypothetical protein
MEEFAGSRKGNDELSVEATGNSRWFCQAIGEQVRRVVVVNPHQRIRISFV